MSGLGMAIAGGIEGLGQGLVDRAENSRKEAIAALKRTQDLSDYERKRADKDSDYNRGLSDRRADTQAGYNRQDDATARSSEALQGLYNRDDPFFSLMKKFEAPGGNPDTLFDNSQKEGKPFAGVQVSKMTLGELYDFSDPSGEYGQWVKRNNPEGDVATPMGSGQMIGTTLRDTAKNMGLPADTVFTEEVQNRMTLFLAKQNIGRASSQSGKRTALRNTWAGWKSPKNVSDAQLDDVISYLNNTDARSAAFDAVANPDTTPDARRALSRGLGLGGPAKLTNHTWMEDEAGKTVRMGYNGTSYVPIIGAGSKPASGTKNKISARTTLDINKMFEDERTEKTDPYKAAVFEEEVLRLMKQENLTDREALVRVVQAMDFEEKTTTTGEGMNFGIFDLNGEEKTVVEKGEWLGTFKYGDGSSSVTNTSRPAPKDPVIPQDRVSPSRNVPKSTGGLPTPKTESEYNDLQIGDQYIHPTTGKVRAKT